jgi:hypothetical protein
MFAVILSLFFSIRRGLRTRAALHVEVIAIRHQLLVLQRANRDRRLPLTGSDRLLWVWLSRLWTNWRCALVIVKPETVIAGHRRGFRLYWIWKSHHRQGRPSISRELIDLIRNMSLANPRWGAPRIHGELSKLGFVLSEATVAKYMAPSKAALPDLANVLGKPYSLLRLLRGSDGVFSSVVRLRNSVTRSASACPCGRDGISHVGMGSSPTARSIPMG